MSENLDLWITDRMPLTCYHQCVLLLGAQLVVSGWALTAQNNFFYHSYLKGNGSKESMV